MSGAAVELDKLFVYGTLMEGQAQAGLLGAASRVPGTVRGALWALPAGYPALGPGDGTVHGELVELRDPALLTLLDRYEGVDEGLYRRVRIEVRASLRLQLAWVYLMANPQRRGGRRLPQGRWRAPRRR